MQLLNLTDYERAAEEKMYAPYHAYYSGGVADNITRDDNRAAFERLRLRPRMLVDVSDIEMGVEIFGRKIDMPIMISPAAMHKLAHPDGEAATARAAKNAGTIQILSTFSTVAVEKVVNEGYATWFQLYMPKDRGKTERLIARAEQAGCEAIVLTVDVAVPGLRENLVRAAFAVPDDIPRPHMESGVKFEAANGWGVAAAEYLDSSLTWNDLRWLRSITKLPLVIKGVLRADDARRAVDCGIDGIIVSNHGGRQLDTAIASLDALPDVVSAVGDQTTVLMDGGIRRGVDVVKALALGAKAVLVARPTLWGLAVDGEAGASNVLALLRAEFENAMALCGCPTVDSITRDFIA